MRVAILESILTPAGHEVEFDRLLIDGCIEQDHRPSLWVPEGFVAKIPYQAPIERVDGGAVVSYDGASRLKRLYLSILREKRRIAWFNSAYDKLMADEADALIIPTATFRYIKSLRKSRLYTIDKPVYIIFHGINNREKERFLTQARQIVGNPHIHLKVITLRDDLSQAGLANVKLIPPPIFTPKYIKIQQMNSKKDRLLLGVFGQFRREKNIEFLIEAFLQASFTIPVTLQIQGATIKPEDSDLFEEIKKKYEQHKEIVFIHKNLIGREWEEALQNIDVLVMPYASKRYIYHWAAMLFTALGFYKPVLAPKFMNPEVLENYTVGQWIDTDNKSVLAKQLSDFVNTFDQDYDTYQKGLKAANEAYSVSRFIKSLLAV